MSRTITEIVVLIWTLAAIPGLILWGRNYRVSRRTYRAAKTISGNGRVAWAQFSMFLTALFVAVEAIFILVGVTTMLRYITMGDSRFEIFHTTARWILVIGLILASAAISYAAFRWRAIDHQLVDMAREQRRQRAIAAEKKKKDDETS